MKKQAYQKAILERMNPDRTATCEVCGKDSMIVHAFINHETNTIGIMCHECYLKRLNAEGNSVEDE